MPATGWAATKFTIVPLFVDTNVLLYSISTNPDEGQKRVAAESIFDGTNLVLSTQVLSEFYVQATRANRPDPLTHPQAAMIIESMARYPIQPVTYAIVEAAVQTHHRYQLSYRDAAIIEAARASGCDTVLSEDMSHDQDYGGVLVRNPFPS